MNVKDASGRFEDTRLNGDFAQGDLGAAQVGLHDGQQVSQGAGPVQAGLAPRDYLVVVNAGAQQRRDPFDTDQALGGMDDPGGDPGSALAERSDYTVPTILPTRPPPIMPRSPTGRKHSRCTLVALSCTLMALSWPCAARSAASPCRNDLHHRHRRRRHLHRHRRRRLRRQTIIAKAATTPARPVGRRAGRASRWPRSGLA